MRDSLDAEASDGSTECAFPVEQKVRNTTTMAAKQKSLSNVSKSTSTADSKKQMLRRAQSSKAPQPTDENRLNNEDQPQRQRVKKAKKRSTSGETKTSATPVRAPASRNGLRSSMKKKSSSPPPPNKMTSLEATLSSGNNNGKRRVARRNSIGSSICESITKNESTTRSIPAAKKKEASLGTTVGGRVQRRGSMTSSEMFHQMQLAAATPSSNKSKSPARGREKGPRKKRSGGPKPSLKSLSPPPPNSKPKVVKSVSFQEDKMVTESIDNDIMDEEEVKELWYDKYDLECFKGELDSIVDKITTKLVKRTDIWRKSLMRAYDMSSAADSDDCFQDQRSATYKLVTFRLKDVYAETTQLVGMEHLLADDIRFEGNRRRGRILDLMDKQREEKERRKRLQTSMEGDDTADQNKLYEESTDASRACRFFAHGVAVARMAAQS